MPRIRWGDTWTLNAIVIAATLVLRKILPQKKQESK